MAASKETWILNGTVITQDSRRRVAAAHLRVADGRIAAITPRKPSRFPKGARVVDARGLTILPGFVQAHVHLCQTLFRNQADDLELLDWLSKRIWVMEAAHTEETLHASALLGIHELLSSGTTCILDMGTVRHTEAILEAVKATGIRASVGKCLMDHPEFTPPSLREGTREALREAEAIHRRWNDTESGRIRVSYAPRFVISCTETLLKEIARLSREQGAVVHTHASENRKEIELVRKITGAENIEYLHRLGLTSEQLVLAHGIWLNPKEMGILRKTGTHITHCPSSNLKLASGIARVPELRARGINVALGADGAPCNNNLNMFQEMRLAALIHKPAGGPKTMRAQEVLDMATLGGARALGWQDDIGSIEVGKRADLVALDLNSPENHVPVGAMGHQGASKLGRSLVLDGEAYASSIVYASQPAHVRFTMVDGRVVYTRGASTRALMARVHNAQRVIARKLSAR